MCDGFSELMLGSAAAMGPTMGAADAAAAVAAGTMTAADAAAATAALPGATAGLFGAGGTFGLAQTASTLGLLSSVGAGVTGALGSEQQANAQSAMANYQAQVMKNRQTIAEQDAQSALDEATTKEQQQRFKTAGDIGAQRARLAAYGVDLDSGSPLDIQSDAATLGELNALDIRETGQQQAYAALGQAMDDGASAGLDAFKAAEAQQAGDLGTAYTLLGTTASLAKHFPY